MALQCLEKRTDNTVVHNEVVLRPADQTIVERFARDDRLCGIIEMGVGADPGGRIPGADANRRSTEL